MLRIYEPNQPELEALAPLKLEDQTVEMPSLEGGFIFHIGTAGDEVAEAQCSGSFTGELLTNNAHKDQLRLTSATVGDEGACEGPFGTPQIMLGGFPLTVTIGSTGKAQITGKLEAALDNGSGVPSSCEYKGKLTAPGKVPTAGKFTMNIKGELTSPTHQCLKLFIATDPEEAPIVGVGLHESLYITEF